MQTPFRRVVAGRIRRALCLGSGEGGFLEDFCASPAWEVVRVDHNPAYATVPHTLIRDILHWTDWIDEIRELGPFELICFSPDCTEFSTANALATPNLDLLRAGLDLIDCLNPKFYIIENVAGAQTAFKPLLGRAVQHLGPFYFWGVFPYMAVHVERRSSRVDESHLPANSPKRAGLWLFNGEAYTKWSHENRAKIPLSISHALRIAIETHLPLSRWSHG